MCTRDWLVVDGTLDLKAVGKFIQSSEYNQFFILASAIESLCKQSNAAKTSNSLDEQTQVVGEIRDAKVSIKIANDQMSAEMTIESPYSRAIRSYNDVIALLRPEGVKSSIRKTRFNNLLFEASAADSGLDLTDVVSRALHAREG